MASQQGDRTRVYEFAVQEGYEWVVPLDSRDYGIFQEFDGTSRRATWTPVRVKLLQNDKSGRPRAESDFPLLGSHAPVLRKHAVELVGELFRADGEFLPLSCESADLQVFNVLTVIDALDLERSELARIPNSNQIIGVRAHVFVPERIRGAKIFKVPQLLKQSVYVTDEIVEAVTRSGLKGVGFRLLWEETATEHAVTRADQ